MQYALSQLVLDIFGDLLSKHLYLAFDVTTLH